MTDWPRRRGHEFSHIHRPESFGQVSDCPYMLSGAFTFKFDVNLRLRKKATKHHLFFDGFLLLKGAG